MGIGGRRSQIEYGNQGVKLIINVVTAKEMVQSMSEEKIAELRHEINDVTERIVSCLECLANDADKLSDRIDDLVDDVKFLKKKCDEQPLY